MKVELTALFLLLTLNSFVECNPVKMNHTHLQYLIRMPKTASANPPLLIMLHGIGSNEKDLFSMAEGLPDRFLIVSLRAPFVLSAGSYAWYHADFSQPVPVINAQEAAQSKDTLIRFIHDLRLDHSFDEKQVYLLGFSQGAIMSYSVALTRPDLIKGMALMSGRMLEEVKPLIDTTKNFKDMNAFISHGLNDQVLNVKYAREGKVFLDKLHIPVTYKEYPEGHTISHEMFQDLLHWLQ